MFIRVFLYRQINLYIPTSSAIYHGRAGSVSKLETSYIINENMNKYVPNGILLGDCTKLEKRKQYMQWELDI